MTIVDPNGQEWGPAGPSVVAAVKVSARPSDPDNPAWGVDVLLLRLVARIEQLEEEKAELRRRLGLPT